MTAPLIDLARSWWDWCAAVSLQLAVLFLVVAVLDRLLRRWVGPQMLAALWLLVVVKLVVPPTLGSSVSPLNLWESPSLLASPLPAALESETVPAFFVWLSGCGLLGAACLRRCRGLRREWLGGVSQPVPMDIAAVAREAAERLGLHRLPEVRISPSARGPAVVGFLRLVVVVPARLIETATREEVLHVLLHELAHVKRRDPLLQLLCVIAQVVFWFHPSVWLARGRLSTLAELCCDQAVAAALGGSTAEYRRTLLRLARPMLAPKPFGSLAFFRRRSQLLLRIEWLDRGENGRRGNGPHGSGRPLLRRVLVGSLCTLVLFCCLPPARPRAGAAELSLPPLESLQGCLQLRYAVQAALARRSLDLESTQPPSS